MMYGSQRGPTVALASTADAEVVETAVAAAAERVFGTDSAVVGCIFLRLQIGNVLIPSSGVRLS